MFRGIRALSKVRNRIERAGTRRTASDRVPAGAGTSGRALMIASVAHCTLRVRRTAPGSACRRYARRASSGKGAGDIDGRVLATIRRQGRK